MTPHFLEIGERTGLTAEVRRNTFVIAGVRNPCDYYVSLWTFTHQRAWAKTRNEEFKGSLYDFDKQQTDVSKFHNWLKWVQGPRHSIMSVRFWETLVAKVNTLSCWGDVYGKCTKQVDDDKVDAELSQFSPRTTADCWVHVETYLDDLRACLTLYEQASGVKVNSSVFKSQKKAKKNKSVHLSCEYYYNTSSEAQDSVLRTDKRLFEAFGYRSCCGKATGPMK